MFKCPSITPPKTGKVSDCFHGTKVFVADRSRAFIRLSSRLRGGSLIQVPKTPSAFHPHAQQDAFRRRDPRQQRRWSAGQKPPLRRSPNSNRFTEIVRDDLPIFQSHRSRQSAPK